MSGLCTSWSRDMAWQKKVKIIASRLLFWLIWPVQPGRPDKKTGPWDTHVRLWDWCPPGQRCKGCYSTPWLTSTIVEKILKQQNIIWIVRSMYLMIRKCFETMPVPQVGCPEHSCYKGS